MGISHPFPAQAALRAIFATLRASGEVLATRLACESARADRAATRAAEVDGERRDADARADRRLDRERRAWAREREALEAAAVRDREALDEARLEASRCPHTELLPHVALEDPEDLLGEAASDVLKARTPSPKVTAAKALRRALDSARAPPPVDFGPLTPPPATPVPPDPEEDDDDDDLSDEESKLEGHSQNLQEALSKMARGIKDDDRPPGCASASGDALFAPDFAQY